MTDTGTIQWRPHVSNSGSESASRLWQMLFCRNLQAEHVEHVYVYVQIDLDQKMLYMKAGAKSYASQG